MICPVIFRRARYAPSVGSPSSSGSSRRGPGFTSRAWPHTASFATSAGSACSWNGLPGGALKGRSRARPLALGTEPEPVSANELQEGRGVVFDLLGEIAFEEGEHERAFVLLERSAALCGETGFRWLQAGGASRDLAERTQQLGRYEDAARWAREALAVGHQIGDRQWLVYSFAVLARAAAERGDQSHAGRLWGALEREEERGPVGQWEREGERSGYAEAVLARTGVAFERSREEGRRLSLDEAVELALLA